MADTTERTLRLLGLLQAHRQWSGDELASRLETTPRTVRRDIDRLRTLGYPVESVRGNGGGYQLAAGAAMPPLLVDEEEAVAIAAALRSAASGAAAGLAEQSVRALAKVTQVLPKPLRRRVEAVQSMSVAEAFGVSPPLDAETLSTLALACRDQVQVRFDYLKAGAAQDATESRLVEPLRLVPVGRRWYLVAFDLDRFDWRTFRLDRMSAPEPTTRAFRPRRLPGDDPAAFVRDGLSRSRTDDEVVALVALDAQVVQEKVGRWATVTQTARGTQVTMRYSLSWVMLALAELDADYEFLTIPDAMLRQLRGTSARAQRALFLADSA